MERFSKKAVTRQGHVSPRVRVVVCTVVRGCSLVHVVMNIVDLIMGATVTTVKS